MACTVGSRVEATQLEVEPVNANPSNVPVFPFPVMSMRVVNPVLSAPGSPALKSKAATSPVAEMIC